MPRFRMTPEDAAAVVAYLKVLPYTEVILAGLIPALLYYFGVFIQVGSEPEGATLVIPRPMSLHRHSSDDRET